jgi:hypothetical protein
MSESGYAETVRAADELVHFAKLLTDDESSRLGPIAWLLLNYRAARAELLLGASDQRWAVVEAADEVAEWVADLVDAESESPAKQSKSLLGLLSLIQHYEEVRSRFG